MSEPEASLPEKDGEFWLVYYCAHCGGETSLPPTCEPRMMRQHDHKDPFECVAYLAKRLRQRIRKDERKQSRADAWERERSRPACAQGHEYAQDQLGLLCRRDKCGGGASDWDRRIQWRTRNDAWERSRNAWKDWDREEVEQELKPWPRPSSKEKAIPRCNLCGDTCALQDPNSDGAHGLINAVVCGHYASTPGKGGGALDDTTSYEFSLCEFCLDFIFTHCKIPPHVWDSGITGDLHLGKKLFRPAPVRVDCDEWRKDSKEDFYQAAEFHDALRLLKRLVPLRKL